MGRLNKKIVLEAIKNTGGVVSAIATKLKVDWHTAQTYINKWPETKQAYINEEETILDVADAALYMAIKKEEAWAVKWIQSTKGKKRGYVEKTETDVNFTSPLNLIFQPDKESEPIESE